MILDDVKLTTEEEVIDTYLSRHVLRYIHRYVTPKGRHTSPRESESRRDVFEIM